MELTHYLPPMFPLKTLGIILTLLTHHCTQGRLEIRKTDSAPIQSLPGHNITIPCHFYGYESPLDLSYVLIRWTLTTLEGKEKDVYEFKGGDRTPYRPGSYIPDSELMEGDGSLYIPKAQSSDEGEYTCIVLLTPEKVTSKVTVRVSATPTCTVNAFSKDFYPETERSLTCYVSGFYPEYVRIHWMTYSKVSSRKSNLNTQTCTSIPDQNQDETYNVSSKVFLTPMSTDEDGDVYSCIIHHKTLTDPLTCNVTLSVQYDDRLGPGGIIGIIVAAVVAIAVLGALLYIICIKVRLHVPEISYVNDMIHTSHRIMNCQISGFRPKNLLIKLYLKKGENKKEICSWSLVNSGQKSHEKDTEQAMPLHDVKDMEQSDLRLKPVITSDKWFSFSCDCFIHITPRLQKHNGAVLILEVDHAALISPICRSQILSVRSSPIMEEIQSKQESYKAGDDLELTCGFYNFYPKSIQVSWFKNTEKISSSDIDAKEEENGLYSATVSLPHRITEDDFGKIFQCIVYHCGESTGVEWKLKKTEN